MVHQFQALSCLGGPSEQKSRHPTRELPPAAWKCRANGRRPTKPGVATRFAPSPRLDPHGRTHSVIIRPCTCTVQSLVIISQVELGPWIPLPSDFLPLLAPLQIFPLYGAVTADIPAKSPAFPLHRLISGCHGSEIACGNDSQKFRTSSCRYGGPHIQLPHHIFNFLRRMAATRLKVGF
jgi:hypothetical protein